jgi:hypothetical protein
LIFLGTAEKYVTGSNNKGNLQMVYEVSTAQDVSNYDYYTIHAYITGTPGDSLYSNGYDLDEVYTLIEGASTSTLYKHGPNTSSSATTYSVDLGFSGSKNGVELNFGLSWTRPREDVTIAKTLVNNYKCEWTADIDDWQNMADYSYTFEPGGTVRVSSTSSYARIWGYGRVKVDKWNESPSTAAYGGLYFYCYPDRVE